MIYFNFKGKEISALGLGTMRFPKCGDKDSDIDIPRTREMIDYAIKNGINYFDTAYGYHGGKSEIVTGELLSAYDRESYYLASKFPGYDLKNIKNKEQIFEEQLKKCKVDYFDFYLLHTITEDNAENYLSEEYGLIPYLLEEKKKGRIRHLGFSVHSGFDCFKDFLQRCGEHMEFCQVQLNYLDWTKQNAKAKVELLNEMNIPVWVMEPVRGGRLANLSDEDTALLKEMRPDESNAAWAFRYLQTLKGVAVTLSGMSDMDQLKENIETYKEAKTLSEKEMDTLYAIAHRMTNEIPCTACRYCVPYCPKKLDIPEIISTYNNNVFDKRKFRQGEEDSRNTSNCIGCKACERVCPQSIEISKVMEKFTEKAGLYTNEKN